MAASFGYTPERLLLQSLSYTKPGQTLFSLSYGYTQNGGNNGQITNITDNVDSGRTVNYTYDALYRLKTALTTGSASYPQWGLSWTYDRYGNRTAQTVTNGSGPSNAVTVSATTNRLTDPGYSYDANGNMTNDGLNALTYDAENRVVTSSGSTYSYDGNSLRVSKSVSGATTVYIFSGTKVIAEYVNGSLGKEYIYSGPGLLATIESGTTKYHHGDHLSVRVATDAGGNVLAQQGHYPFGESWYQGSGGTKWQFTSYERDAESGNDYAMARYHVNRLGRFNSPDPVRGSIGNPQSLNRYAYVRNGPVNLLDPLGLNVESGWCAPSDGNCGAFSWMFGGGGGAGDAGGGGGCGSFGPAAYEVWAEGLARYLAMVAAQFDRARAKETPYVDTQVLGDCVQQRFDVTLYAFKGSTPGGRGGVGYFIGYGQDARSRAGQSGLVVVTNDAATYTSAQLNERWAAAHGRSVPRGTTVGGLTDPRDPLYPYNNFTANNLTPMGTIVSQVHELGHSLYRIISGLSPFVEEPQDMGRALQNCVRGTGGFQWR